MKFRLALPCLAALLVLGAVVRADEGMWLFSAPPRDQIKAKYGFDVTDPWLEHLMQASVRFNSGGSGSFVSADGLVITNHHVGAGDLEKFGDAQHNYLHDGFYAATPADEKKCFDLELNVLQSIEDVTARVNAAIPPGATGPTAADARRSVIAVIEKESREQTGLRSDVVTLYQGGQYHLYRFKRYTDIRLVFAPEQQAAFFGGDPDNFEFPRYNLDVCLFRVYDNGQPVHPEHFLKWSAAGAQENELVFVSGHPGRTSRQFTTAELATVRDTQNPYMLAFLKRLEILLDSWTARSEENSRRGHELLMSLQNSRKVYDGEQAGLYSPAIMDAKAAQEAAFRKQLHDVKDGAETLAAFDRIATAQAALSKLFRRERLLEGDMRSAFRAPHGLYSTSFTLARVLLRAADERAKPNGDRLKEYADARHESLELELFSDEPIYTDFEILKLGDSLTFLAEQLGYDDPVVQAALGGQSPRERAAALINGTQVRDVAFRKKLYEGGAAAVAASHDPMIEVARAIDGAARAARREWENLDEAKQQAHATIEHTRFALEGTGNPPDATFTLRLSYGPIRGYEQEGLHVSPFTDFAGLYERAASHHNREPFDLPPRWVGKKSALDLATPFDFVSTGDIIGGNSGSPTVNRAGEFVGIIFDGNIQSLIGDFVYEDVQSRAVSVDSRAIIEALRHVYDVPALAGELTNGHR